MSHLKCGLLHVWHCDSLELVLISLSSDCTRRRSRVWMLPGRFRRKPWRAQLSKLGMQGIYVCWFPHWHEHKPFCCQSRDGNISNICDAFACRGNASDAELYLPLLTRAQGVKAWHVKIRRNVNIMRHKRMGNACATLAPSSSHV